MKASTIRQALYALAAPLCVLSLDAPASACGINWRIPTTYFENVDEKGYACYSERVAEIDLGGGLKLPLIVNFQSERESISPYLGKGWVLALFESRIVQT